ncbi:DUF5719 family protein [Agrococcus jejuensis]|uniref:DUF5719 family protein n=1 Tax=Agrococcus jejuensis TaxID=399736 RepID=UPI0011A845AB|nr:DUF5719 family protein [Agrococcus jejuensis]
MSDDRTGPDEQPIDAAAQADDEALDPTRDDASDEAPDAATTAEPESESEPEPEPEPEPEDAGDVDTNATGADDVDLATDVTATDREAAAIEAAERARALEPRTVGLWGVRAAAGIATLAIGVLAVLAAPSLPTVQADARIASVAPDAPAETRVCAGPLLGIGDASGDAGAVAALAQPSLNGYFEESASIAFDEGDGAATVLQGPGVGGAEALGVDTTTAAGVAASACTEPATSQWLVGGATTTGRTSVLTVANPGTAATSVDVSIFGPEGQVDAVGSTGIAIAGGSVAVVDLAAFAPGLAAPVVQVTSSGGPVTVHLQHTVVRTLQPGGVDVVDSTQASTDLAIPGVIIGEPTGLQTREGFADAVPALRVLAGESTTATVTTIADGDEPIAATLDLVGGQVQEIDLSGLAPGTYAFTIEADVPIVAAARQVRVDGDAIDLDWVAGQSAWLDGTTTMPVTAGEDGRVHVLSLSDEPTTVTIGDDEVELAPGAFRTLPVEEGVTFVEGRDVVLAVTFSGSAGIAGYAITPRIAAREGIDVVL